MSFSWDGDLYGDDRMRCRRRRQEADEHLDELLAGLEETFLFLADRTWILEDKKIKKKRPGMVHLKKSLNFRRIRC